MKLTLLMIQGADLWGLVAEEFGKLWNDVCFLENLLHCFYRLLVASQKSLHYFLHQTQMLTQPKYNPLLNPYCKSIHLIAFLTNFIYFLDEIIQLTVIQLIFRLALMLKAIKGRINFL